MTYTVNDRRGTRPVDEVCRVCGSEEVHTTNYNQPTMACVAYLRALATHPGFVIYLACPYTSDDLSLREFRVQRANETAAALMAEGKLVFSPLSHSHPIATQCDLPVDFHYWQEWNKAMISRCDALYVLELDGWQDSKGVVWEIEFAQSMKIPVIRLNREFGVKVKT